MLVSAQARRLDYVVRPLYAKNNRRPDDDEAPLAPFDEGDDEKRRGSASDQGPEAVFDEDYDTLEYSRTALARVEIVARRDMVAETVRPAPTVNAAALLSLIAAAKVEGPSGTIVPVTVGKPAVKPPSPKADAFYDLLDQVIAKA